MRRSSQINRLLIIRNDRLGDLILTLPAINYARQAFPEATITALVSPRTAALLHGNSDVDSVLTDDGESTGWELGRRLKPYDFDAVAVIHSSTRNCLAVWRARIPLRVTWAHRPWSWLLGNRLIRLHRSHPPIHESDFAIAFVKRLKNDTRIRPEVSPLSIPDETLRRMRTRLAADLGSQTPWIGVHPGSSNSAYNWPPSRYAELVRRLVDYGRVVLTGGPGEEALLASIYRSVPQRSQSHVACYHEFSLLELAAAISNLDVITVSNTGPMHLAGLVGTPVVALFSSHLFQSPKKWEPLGGRKTILQAPWPEEQAMRGPPHRAWEHMCQISVDDVVEANLRFLAEVKATGLVSGFA